MSQISQTTALIPNWTADDFDSEKPYQWLYERKDSNKFLFVKMLKATKVKAQSVGVTGEVFNMYWKAYVEAMKPQTTILGANTTAFTGQEKVLSGVSELECGAYQCDDNGVSYTNQMGSNVQVISHPLLPIRRIENIDSGEERIQLAYKRGTGQPWRTIIVRNDVVSTAQKITVLSNSGLAVNSENAKEVVRYLSDIQSRNFDAIPLQKSTSHLGWTEDGSFIPYAQGIEYDGIDAESKRMFEAFCHHGDRDTWMDIAKKARAGKSVPCRIALASAFAAPLVSRFSALPFIVHLYGQSGTGKSVGLMLSASVWANPHVGDPYVQTFQATKVALEAAAVFSCNVPVYIDESQLVADRKTLDDLIYMLCQGSSKPRGTKDGGLQSKKRWETCIVTTGEAPLVKTNSGGGASARTIEVAYGNTPFFEDSRGTAELLKEHYGFAGPEYIKALQEPNAIENLRMVQEQYYRELSQQDIHPKQILSASLLLAADQLADVAIFHDGNSLTANDIKPYLVTNQQANINYRCYQWLMGFIAQNPKRFETDDNNGELWGIRDGNIVYFIRTAFEKVMTDNGYSASVFLDWAKLTDKIRYDNYGTGNSNNRLTKRKTINGHPTTCVALVMDETEGFVEVDEPMPF